MKARGKGAGVATSANWLANYVVSSGELSLNALMAPGLFYLSAAAVAPPSTQSQPAAADDCTFSSPRTAAPSCCAAQIALLYPIVIGDGAKEVQRVNVGWTMVAFGLVVLVSFFYIYKFVPETHKKTLEEIERSFSLAPVDEEPQNEDVPLETLEKGEGKGPAAAAATATA